jgi:uncharacterized membrane protein
MLGVAIALVAIGLVVLIFFPILGVVIGAVGLIFLIGQLIVRSRRAAAEDGRP